MPAANPSKLSAHSQAKLTLDEHKAWLRIKRELARLVRGLEDLNDLRRKYGNHRHFDITQQSQEVLITAAEKEMRDFETELESKYQKKGA